MVRSNLHTRKWIAAVVLLLTVATAGPLAMAVMSESATAATADSYTVTVTEVTDGDTITIRYQNGTTDTVRMLGVDTPEVYAENTPDEYEGVPDTTAGKECLAAAGEAASNYTKQHLEGETVTVKTDTEADRRGDYGRLLAYVIDDGQNFTYQLVDSGNARVYDSTFSQSESFYAAESDAQNAERGLWSCRTPTSDGTETGSVSLSVTTIHADAAGNDNENLNDEYVTLENTGSSTVDFAGYTVTDEVGKTYTFESLSLNPGETVTLHTGDGSDSLSDVYWGRSGAVWNNGGDTVTVSNDSGHVVAQRAY